MNIKGDQAQIAQYQKALGGLGTVSFEGHEPSLHKDSKQFRNMFGNAYERKLPALSRPGKGIRHDYLKWKKLFQLEEQKFLEMLK